jgi:hypothetical protein
VESAALFPVEIRLVERTEDALTTQISAIQEWIDDRGYDPSTFRYTFFDVGILLRVDFKLEPEAIAFASEFSGLGAYLSEVVSPPRSGPPLGTALLSSCSN